MLQYLVVLCLTPTIVEKFEDKVDAETFAALMSRTQKRNYLVLESISKWEHSSEN